MSHCFLICDGYDIHTWRIEVVINNRYDEIRTLTFRHYLDLCRIYYAGIIDLEDLLEALKITAEQFEVIRRTIRWSS